MEAPGDGRREPPLGALIRSHQRAPHASFIAIPVLLPKLKAQER